MSSDDDELGIKRTDVSTRPFPTRDGVGSESLSHVFSQGNKWGNHNEHPGGIQQGSTEKSQTFPTSSGHDGQDVVAGEAALYKLSLLMRGEGKQLGTMEQGLNSRSKEGVDYKGKNLLRGKHR